MPYSAAPGDTSGFDIDVNAATVPEPGTLGILFTAMLALAGVRRATVRQPAGLRGRPTGR